MNDKPEEAASFADVIKDVRDKSGKAVLSSDEILLLACDELSRTYTFEEKHYR